MDVSLYKKLTVQRGLTYRYYWSPPASGKPTLLFLHGFASSSYNWHRQVSYFLPLGYGILAPDLLGAGGTDKPVDAQAFRMNAMVCDAMDILSAEGLAKVVAVAHSMGTFLLSRLALLYPTAFLAYSFISITFSPPVIAPFDLESVLAQMKDTIGHEAFAYWQFFLREDAPRVIQDHIDSFMQLIYVNTPEDWLTHFTTRGKTAECIDGNLLLGRPHYLSDEEYDTIRGTIIENGMDSTLTWYRAWATDVNLEDSRNIPEDTWKLRSPTLMIIAPRDYVGTPAVARERMMQYGTDVEYPEVDSGHFAYLERTEEVNAGLRSWLERRGW